MMLRINFQNKFLLVSFLFIGVIFSSQSQAHLATSAAIGAAVKSQFSTGKIQINKIELEEPHIIPLETVKKFFAQYEGNEITVNDLKEIQSRLSKYYYVKGYINSGVIVPNQRISNGVIRLRAVHGRLTRVKARGNQRVSNAYIKNAVAKGVSVPLNSEKLQQALEALQRNPLIDEVKAHISPGEKLGQSILELEIKEAKPYFLNADISNHQSPSIGQYRLGISGGHRDLMGFRDTFKLNLGLSEGLVDANADYTFPLGVNDYLFNTYFNYSKFSIIDDEFAPVDIKSDSTTMGVSLSAPLYKTAQTEVSAGIGLDVKHMTLSMFDSPAEVNGFVDGEMDSTPLVFHVNASYQQSKFVSAMYAGLRRGTTIDLYGDSDPRSVFTVAIGQVSIGFKPASKLEWHFRINGQLTRDELLAVEKFAIGGARTVRAYRENLLVRDNGLVASTQLRYSVYKSKVFVVPFIDYGRSWNSSQGKFGSGGEQIYSAGAGVQWKATKSIYSELFWGKTLADINNQTDLTQDHSLHFLIKYTAF